MSDNFVQKMKFCLTPKILKGRTDIVLCTWHSVLYNNYVQKNLGDFKFCQLSAKNCFRHTRGRLDIFEAPS